MELKRGKCDAGGTVPSKQKGEFVTISVSVVSLCGVGEEVGGLKVTALGFWMRRKDSLSFEGTVFGDCNFRRQRIEGLAVDQCTLGKQQTVNLKVTVLVFTSLTQCLRINV